MIKMIRDITNFAVIYLFIGPNCECSFWKIFGKIERYWVQFVLQIHVHD